MSDTLIGTALQARVQAFQNMTSKKLWFEDVLELRGAAQLALDVAVLADNQGLKDEAAAVMQMLDDLERSAEEEEQARRQEVCERDEQRQLNRKENYRLVKMVIGMEFDDPRWQHLVKSYQQAFPTVIVAASVTDKISPKSLSSMLRGEVVEMIYKKHKSSLIGRAEIEAVRGEAM